MPMVPFGHKRGMTMAEVIIAISIFLIIIGTVYAFEVNTFSYNKTISVALNTAQDAQVILRTLSYELRTMVPGANGSYPLVAAGTSTITFFADIDKNGLPEQIRYYMNGTSMMRGTISPAGSPYVYNPATETVKQIATNIRNSSSTPIFEYYDGTYDGNDAALVQPVAVSAVRLVKISLNIDYDPNAPPISRVYTSQVTLRNLKDNL